MKFCAKGNSGRNRLLSRVLWCYLLFILFYWASGFVFFYDKFSFSPEGVARYFFGTPAFPEIISLMQLVQDSHIQIVTIGILLLTLSAFILDNGLPTGLKSALTVFSFISAAFEVASGYLVYYLGRDFAFVRLVSFFIFQTILLCMLILSAANLLKKERRTDSGDIPRPNWWRFIVVPFAFLNVLFVIVTAFFFLGKIGQTPADISLYYLGDISKFTRPKTFSGLFEISYAHLLPVPLYLAALLHFLSFTRFRGRAVLAFLVIFSAAGDIVAGYFVRFLSADLSYMKLLPFWVLEISLFVTSLALIRYPPDAYQVSPEPFSSSRSLRVP